jgi:hypothetical protein
LGTLVCNKLSYNTSAKKAWFEYKEKSLNLKFKPYNIYNTNQTYKDFIQASEIPSELSVVDYHNLMLHRLDEVSDERVKALGKIERDKLRVAKSYNKRVKEKSFQVEDLVWKMILPIGSRSSKFGKWSPNWEGPYRIEEVIPVNSYMVSVQGTLLPRTINGKYLKMYYPSVWQDTLVRKWPIMLLSSLAPKNGQ